MLNKEQKCLLLIIVIFIAACIETDIYLPAFADMMTFFSISEDKIQSLLTWNFIGICASGPLYGPLSDTVGRKKPLMFALGLFLFGSLITLCAQNFNVMLVGRVFQGLGSGGCFTLGTAIMFDAFQEQKAMQALNKLQTVIPFIMAVAPMVGGYLNYVYGFRSNFLAIALCVLISFIVCLFFFDETLPENKRIPFQIYRILADFKKVSMSLPFWQTTMIVSLLFAGYLAFLSGISVLFVIEFHVSKQALPFYQAALLGAWVCANLTFKHSLERWGIAKIKGTGIVLVVLGGIELLGAMLMTPQNPYFLTAGMILYAFGVNWIQSLYFPEGMQIFPDIKGITASFLNSARLLITALIVGLASQLYNGTLYPIVGVVLGVIVIILMTIVWYEKNRPQERESVSHDSLIEMI